MSGEALDDEECARAAALHARGVLGAPPESRYDQVVPLAQSVPDVPMAAVNLVDTDRQWTEAQVGPDGLEDVALIRSVRRYTVQRSGPVIVPGPCAHGRRHRRGPAP